MSISKTSLSLPTTKRPFQGKILSWMQTCVLSAAMCLMSSAFATDSGVPIDTDVLINTTSTWAGDPIQYLETETPVVRAQTVVFAPGAQTTWHYHPLPSYIYVLAGTFLVETSDGRMQQFNAGQAFVEVVNVLHRGTNVGTEPAKLLIFYTGDGRPVMTTAPMPLNDDDKDNKGKKKGHDK